MPARLRVQRRASPSRSDSSVSRCRAKLHPETLTASSRSSSPFPAAPLGRGAWRRPDNVPDTTASPGKVRLITSTCSGRSGNGTSGSIGSSPAGSMVRSRWWRSRTAWARAGSGRPAVENLKVAHGSGTCITSRIAGIRMVTCHGHYCMSSLWSKSLFRRVQDRRLSIRLGSLRTAQSRLRCDAIGGNHGKDRNDPGRRRRHSRSHRPPQRFIGMASRRSSSSASKLGRLWEPGSWSTPTACACCLRWVLPRASRMPARSFADGNFVTSRGTCYRKPISRRCGAMSVPASASSGPSCNARCCQGVANVRCRLGTSVTSLVQDDHRVSVGFSDGSTGDYDLVVGADGIKSTVRALTLTAARAERSGCHELAQHCPDPPGRPDRPADAPGRWLHIRARAYGCGAHLRLRYVHPAALSRSARGTRAIHTATSNVRPVRLAPHHR